ncbi:hypothetical protein BS78_08G060600 [Paspalum vaginatum]|nr:hypothetical protein BS78_08G060600 [Paspalum vaginatum]
MMATVQVKWRGGKARTSRGWDGREGQGRVLCYKVGFGASEHAPGVVAFTSAGKVWCGVCGCVFGGMDFFSWFLPSICWEEGIWLRKLTSVEKGVYDVARRIRKG